MNWTPRQGPFGDWQSGSDEFPNGWTAVVSDTSQMVAPRQTTAYAVSACCRWWIVSGRQSFDNLAEAKREAIILAMQQGEACADPSCRVEMAAGEHI
jgi:hypothetical protein